MKNRYCESPAIGISAPKCSENCCDYGGCHKKAYFEYIANKYNTTPDKIAIGTNFQFDKFVIDDREYTKEEVLEILKKHKEEEAEKLHKPVTEISFSNDLGLNKDDVNIPITLNGKPIGIITDINEQTIKAIIFNRYAGVSRSIIEGESRVCEIIFGDKVFGETDSL